MSENMIFNCEKCGKAFFATPQDYRTTFWRGDFIKESYCPYCGAIIQIHSKDNSFSSSNGGKF